MTRPFTSTCICVYMLLASGCSNSDSAIARANGTPITQSQWDEYVRVKRLKFRSDEQKTRALDEYAINIGLASAIEGEKLVDPHEIQAEADAVKRQLLINRYFEKYLESKVTENDIQSYYDEHASEFQNPSVHVAQILIRTNPRMTSDELKAKRAVAQAAYEQLRGGAGFSDVATAVSEDPGSRSTGGDLGWLREGANVVSQRAFKLKPGEITEPFQTPTGYHIVKQLEPIKSVPRPLAQAQAAIRNQLRAGAKAAETERLVAKAQIEIHGKSQGEVNAETQVNTAREAHK